MSIRTIHSTKTIMTFLVVFMSMFNPMMGQTFQMHNGDTINVVDINNMKQGHWIYFGSMKPIPGFEPESKVEEGDFKNSRKNGTWIKYYPNGNVHSEITFVNNRPNGAYKTYYENGVVEEEGVWKNNRNTGHFERHYENGELQQKFEFNETGKREGRQEYFYENGQLMIEGDWNGGKENGEIKEYYANGDIKSIKVFNDGGLDAAASKKFEPKSEIKEVPTQPKEVKESEVVKEEDANIIATVKTGNATKAVAFTGNGQHTLYNKNRQVSQKGEFKNHRLWNGKWYRYDANGILTAIEIYKDGKYIGDGVIED